MIRNNVYISSACTKQTNLYLTVSIYVIDLIYRPQANLYLVDPMGPSLPSIIVFCSLLYRDSEEYCKQNEMTIGLNFDIVTLVKIVYSYLYQSIHIFMHFQYFYLFQIVFWRFVNLTFFYVKIAAPWLNILLSLILDIKQLNHQIYTEAKYALLYFKKF